MMSEIINAEYTEVMPARLSEIAAEINFYSTNVLMNVIEIGRRFEEAKSLCPRGEWGKWCKNSTGYEQSMAENYMKIYREYGGGQLNLGGDFSNSQSLASLGVTKLLELTKVPAEEREKFVEENDITADTTVKELKEKIKQLTEEKEKVVQEKEDVISDMENAVHNASDKIEEYEEEIKELKNRIEQMNSNPVESDSGVFSEMIKEAEEKAREEFEAKIKQLTEEKEKVEKKVNDLNDKIKAEKEKASAAAESEKAMKEKYDAAQAELIKAKKAANASGNQDIAKINVLFTDIQSKIKELNSTFEAVGDLELQSKVTNVLLDLLQG